MFNDWAQGGRSSRKALLQSAVCEGLQKLLRQRVELTPLCLVLFDGQPYQFLQFHFHDPSEHHIDGSSIP